MAETVGDFIVRRLRDWGVRRVFGYPGDGIDAVVLGKALIPDDLPFVTARSACSGRNRAGT